MIAITTMRCRPQENAAVHRISIGLIVMLAALLPALLPGELFGQSKLGVNSLGSHTLVLHPSGSVFSWGYNNSGQLGVGNRDNVAAPQRVLKGDYNGITFLGDNPSNPITAVAALYRHSLALAADGIVYGWGANNMGELGIDPAGNQFLPRRIGRGEYPGASYLGDNPEDKIVALSGGVNLSVVLDRNGAVYTFGRNDYGQLGNGTKIPFTMAPVRVAKGEYEGTAYLGDNPANKVVAIAGGDYHCLALTEDGSVYAWGRNSAGQLGRADTTFQSTPIRVVKGDYKGTIYLGDNPGNRVTLLAAGVGCSLAMLQDGTLLMWGNNDDGRLGDNSVAWRSKPGFVLKGDYDGDSYFGDNPVARITKISVGSSHVLALLEDGRLFAWGNNTYGGLGVNSNDASHVPVRVLKGDYEGTKYFGDNVALPIRDIAAGESFGVAVVGGNEIFTWGYNQRDQLGTGTGNNSLVPIRGPQIPAVARPAVMLSSFTASPVGNQVSLRWTTEYEEGNSLFEIERAADGGAWQKITSQPGAGTSSDVHSYSYDDDTAPAAGLLLYRLRQVSLGGGSSYLDTVSVSLGSAGVEQESSPAILLQNVPNPCSGSTTITYALPSRADVRLEICDLLGHVIEGIAIGRQEPGTYSRQIDLGGVPDGVYYYRLMTESARIQRQLTVVR